MNPFDQAWVLLKAPYNVIDDLDLSQPYPQSTQHEMMFQGGKEGDKDSQYWTSNPDEALMYALFGSDIEEPDTFANPWNYGYAPMRTGTPQIRVAPKTEDNYNLQRDWETSPEVGVHPNIPHEIQSREDTARMIEDLLTRYKGEGFVQDVGGGKSSFGTPATPYDSLARIASSTSASGKSPKAKLAHIEEQLRGFRE
ncbi:MAG: hypothetical protein CMF55_00125 [Legionellales bacterium]|nr:hypothetical protein [Legionellales bacterium]